MPTPPGCGMIAALKREPDAFLGPEQPERARWQVTAHEPPRALGRRHRPLPGRCRPDPDRLAHPSHRRADSAYVTPVFPSPPTTASLPPIRRLVADGDHVEGRDRPLEPLESELAGRFHLDVFFDLRVEPLRD